MIVRRSVETPKFSFILKYTTIQNVTYAPKGGVSINRNIPNIGTTPDIAKVHTRYSHTSHLLECVVDY